MNVELSRRHITQQNKSIIRQIMTDFYWICNNIRKF